MRFIIKLLMSICVIVFATQIGRRAPGLAGLVAVMPITSLVVLLWLYGDNPGNFAVMTDYVKGALWGIVPTVLFFAAALVCFRKQLAIWIVLCASFGVWFAAAIIHQWLLKR